MISRTRPNGTTRRQALAAVSGAGALVAMPSLARAEQVGWIGVSAVAPTDLIAQQVDFFAKRVNELSKGQITLTNRHGGTPGGEREQVEAVLQGAVQVATPGQGLLAGWYRPAEVWAHPYLFKDVAHKDRVWDAVREDYVRDIGAVAKLRPVAAIPRMPRQLSCNKIVRAPADMRGLRIRVPETALWRRTFEMFGASPTPLPFPEVLQALKSGIVDGQENPIALAWDSGIFDANSHLSLTEHMMQDNCLLMSEAVYGKLAPDLKAAVDQAARDSEAEFRPRAVADDKDVLAKIRAKRIVVSDVDKPAFAASVKTLVDEFPAGRKWVERFAQVG